MATVFFADGITVDWVGPELELLELLELLLLLLLLELADGRHGGTISVVTLLLAGRTSSFCGVAPAAEALALPPGVTKMVLAGGGATAWLELELELLLLLELEDDPQGSIATVCVTALRGITITFEPGGTVLVADSPVTAASEQGGIAIVRGLCCLGITTALTPGF